MAGSLPLKAGPQGSVKPRRSFFADVKRPSLTARLSFVHADSRGSLHESLASEVFTCAARSPCSGYSAVLVSRPRP